ncbi:Hypothetical protein DPCES_5052 [Desulfitobacterium hafniense]|uniref:Uncharacterized protein n=1 Tax=Desulfitobacterium hafniense TaxID=49338 RepID=A0A098B7U1_DESHA|nr:Hypothetical protein DPCES_5052 [Desulfitobacterium hafniense]
MIRMRCGSWAFFYSKGHLKEIMHIVKTKCDFMVNLYKNIGKIRNKTL